jgi:predicted transcriptional regulator
MVITSGRVVAGKIVVDGEALPEGAVVTILAREGDETFELDAAMEAELLESLAEADRGELIPADEVLRTLRNSR